MLRGVSVCEHLDTKYLSRCTVMQYKLPLLFSLNPQASPIRAIIPSVTAGTGDRHDSAMDKSRLDDTVEYFLGNCVAPSTCTAYKSAQNCYIVFCSRFGMSAPYPLQDMLCSYVAYLVKDGLKHRTRYYTPPDPAFHWQPIRQWG